jgi:hypothetical protein
MRIHRIKLDNFRGIEAAEVDFDIDGVTIVEGPNEAGKSSLAESIDLILEYPDSTTNAAVKAIKPVNRDTGTTVELEISSGPYYFIYTKTWFRHPSTKLVLTKPISENLTGRQAHDRVRAIIAETVDEALFAALRYKQGVEIAQAALGSSVSLATALDLAASGQSKAGSQEASIFDRVGIERARFFTPAGKPLANRLQRATQMGALTSDVDRFRSELAELEEKSERYRQLDKTLKHLEGKRSEQEVALASSNILWRGVQASMLKVAELNTSWERAESGARESRRNVGDRRALVQGFSEAQDALKACELAAKRDLPAIAAAQHEVDEAMKRRNTVRTQLPSIEAQAKRARNDLDYSRDALNLQLFGARRDKILAEQRALLEANTFLDACPMTEALLVSIEKAFVDVTEASARLSASASTMRIEAFCDVNVTVESDHRSLQALETYETSIVGDTTVVFEDIARIHVTGAASERQLRDELETAQRHIDGLLLSVDVIQADGVPAARRIEWFRLKSVAKAAETTQRIQQDLGDFTFSELSERVTITESRLANYIAARPSEPPMPGNLEEAEIVEGLAADELEKAPKRESLLCEELEDTLTAQGEIHDEAMKRSTKLALVDAQVQKEGERLDAAREQIRDEDLATELAKRDRQSLAAKAEFEKGAAELDLCDPDTIEIRLNNTGELVKRLTREHEEAQVDLAALKTELSVRGEAGLHDQLDAAQSALLHVNREHAQVERLAASVQLLFKSLAANREAAQRSYVAPYREEIERLGRIVFGPDFRVEIDHKTLQIASRTVDGVTVPFASLSGGTREQLCVLSLLACAALISPKGEKSRTPDMVRKSLRGQRWVLASGRRTR